MASADFPFNSEITTSSILAQNNNMFGQGERFTVRGSVMESNTRKLISDVNIEVNGVGYATTGMMGDFKIEVRGEMNLLLDINILTSRSKIISKD